mgnify:CR=1 FL=1
MLRLRYTYTKLNSVLVILLIVISFQYGCTNDDNPFEQIGSQTPTETKYIDLFISGFTVKINEKYINEYDAKIAIDYIEWNCQLI